MPRDNAKRGRAYETSESEGDSEDGRSEAGSDGGRSRGESTTNETTGSSDVSPRGNDTGRVRTGRVTERRRTGGRSVQPVDRYGWIGTWNNPPEPHALLMEYLTEHLFPKVDFFNGQYEMGERTGTKHLQFYFEIPSRRTLSSVVKLFHFTSGLTFSPHLEAKSPFSTFTQAKEYTEKEDTRVGGSERITYGEWRGEPRSAQGKRTDLEEVARLAREGSSMRRIGELYPGQVIRYFGGIRNYQSMYQQPRNWAMEVMWFWGPTGAGKSRTAAELMPDAYYKDGATKWWDNYHGESDVIIDDFRFDPRNNDVSFAYLLRLTDRYKMQVQNKGGFCEFSAKRIIFTSPFSPQMAFAELNEPIGQFLRRLTEIRHFDMPVQANIIN